MFSYVVKRLLVSLLTLFVIVTITFFLMHTVPGGDLEYSVCLFLLL